MSRPAVPEIVERVYEQLEPIAPLAGDSVTADTWPLLLLVDALIGQLGELDDVAVDRDYQGRSEEGLSILLDPDRCPVWALPWLAQFVGISPPTPITYSFDVWGLAGGVPYFDITGPDDDERTIVTIDPDTAQVVMLTGPDADAFLLDALPGRRGGARPELLFDLDSTDLRTLIRERSGWSRGRPATIAAAARSTLIGAQTVSVRERTPDWQHLTVITYDAQTPDPTATLAAITDPTVKPAGILIVYEVHDGWTVGEFEAAYPDPATLADPEGDFDSVGDLESRIPA